MRRILRKIACKDEKSLGDVSTLADPSVRFYITLKSQYVKLIILGCTKIGGAIQDCHCW